MQKLQNMPAQKQQLSQVSSNSAPTLLQDSDGQIAVAHEIHNRFHAMKTYGKEPESLASITAIMLSDLAEFPADKILRAFRTHAQRSEEFPTTANLVNLIKRNGKPPIKESDVIAARKKDGAYRAAQEWAIIREWEAQQQEGWSGHNDSVKDHATSQENLRLRQRVKELEAENNRAWAEVKALRLVNGAAKIVTQFTATEKARNTLEMMHAGGLSEKEISDFATEQGIYITAHDTQKQSMAS